MLTQFKFYGFNGYKKGKCIVCGKFGELQQRFEQSISPWNRKTPEQIYAEETIEKQKWEKLPFVHRRCKVLSDMKAND